MAWTPPTTDAFAQHLGLSAATDLPGVGITVERATRNLRLATDLMILATNCENQPATDTVLGRVTEEGLLAMAHYLVVREEDREELYSPYNSERIGSYSYSKQQVAAAAKSGEDTGVSFFDIAMEELRQRCNDGAGSEVGIYTEEVMTAENPAKELDLAGLESRYPFHFRDPSV